jgi:hypothetical protein
VVAVVAAITCQNALPRSFRRGEDAEVNAAEDAAEEQQRRAATRGGGPKPAGLVVLVERRRVRPNPHIDRDGDEIEDRGEDARPDRRDEQLAD